MVRLLRADLILPCLIVGYNALLFFQILHFCNRVPPSNVFVVLPAYYTYCCNASRQDFVSILFLEATLDYYLNRFSAHHKRVFVCRVGIFKPRATLWIFNNCFTNFSSCACDYFIRMSFRRALTSHPWSRSRNPLSTIPPPANDPYPDLTLALYGLWNLIQPVVGFHSPGAPIIRASDMQAIPGFHLELLETAVSTLLFFFVCFYEIKTTCPFRNFIWLPCVQLGTMRRRSDFVSACGYLLSSGFWLWGIALTSLESSPALSSRATL